MLRAVGIERGYYNPRDWRQSIKVDQILDNWAELLGENAKIVFSFDSKAQAAQKWQECVQNKWRPFLNLIENRLNRDNTRFVAANTVTIADCVMFSIINCIFLND